MNPVASRSHNRIAITGVGMVSPLGFSAWQTFRSLLAGRTIADRRINLEPDVDLLTVVRACGSVACVQHAGLDPSIDLAERAGREALFMAKSDFRDGQAIYSASKGAMNVLENAIHRINYDQTGLCAVLGPHGYVVHHLRKRLGVDFVHSPVSACASALTAVHQARLMLLGQINQPTPSRVLVLTSEAALLPAFVHSYHRLGVLPPHRDYVGRPLDRSRNGFMLAEVGAALLLERCDDPEFELVDTAVACEAFDLVRTNPAMPALRRVAQQLLTDKVIDVLHPHATGTLDNDEAELSAYACRDLAPQLYAHKGALGHTLGSSGLVSLVLAYLIAKTNRLPPMPWLNDPIFPLPAPRSPHPLKTHALFAAGFGGHVAGALLQRNAPH